MQVYKTTIQIPAAVADVFKYLTNPHNFPRWKKDVWLTGKIFGTMGPDCKFVQTIYLMSPRKFMMHVTGFEENKFFKFEALKGFVILPSFSFFFEQYEEGTLLTTLSEINLIGKRVRGILYPMGLSWHWKVYIELLSKELFNGNAKQIKVVSFENMGS